jgi:threonine dehydratase
MSVTVENVDAAAVRLHGKIHKTGLLESIALNNLTHARILVKAECNQKAGSFKIRGAMNRVLCLSQEEQSKGVVAFSSGNFGQGLAAACGSLGVQCTIVMPGDAPTSKQERARSYGATVLTSPIIEGVNREITASEMAQDLSKENGFTLLHPFEDFDVIAGQGTCALEIAEQAREAGIEEIDALLIPHGGGGLTGGCCLAMEREMPSCDVYAVEPEGYDDLVRSLEAGKIMAVEGNPPSLCDSLQASSPGVNTFPVTSRLLAGAMTVNDDEVRCTIYCILVLQSIYYLLYLGPPINILVIVSGSSNQYTIYCILVLQ